jgi:hypothetical protein
MNQNTLNYLSETFVEMAPVEEFYYQELPKVYLWYTKIKKTNIGYQYAIHQVDESWMLCEVLFYKFSLGIKEICVHFLCKCELTNKHRKEGY